MILYGVHGEGLGHCIRALSVMELFPNTYFIIFTHKDGYEYLSKNKPKNLLAVHLIKGLEFSYKNGSVSGFTNPLLINKIYKENKIILDYVFSIYGRDKIKACITDWELSISRFSFEKGLPCVSIDNQHKFKLGKFDGLSFIDKVQLAIAKKFCDWIVPYATDYIIVTFKDGNYEDKGANWVPIIPSKSLSFKKELDITAEDFNLVYCKVDTSKDVLKELPIGKTKFYCSEPISGKDIEYCKIDRDKFLEDLVRCKHLYTNGGNTLVTEALFLNKPLTVIPIKNHFEQKFTKICLDKLDNKVDDRSYIIKEIVGKYL